MPSLVSILNSRASQTPDGLAYVFLNDRDNQEHRVTYQQLQECSQAVAARLQSSIPPGVAALLIYPRQLEFFIAFLGCLAAGITAVPAYPPRSSNKFSRLESIIKDVQPRIVLTTDSVLASIKDRLTPLFGASEIQWLSTDNLEADGTKHWTPKNFGGDSLAFLQYTSGSTGTPKGVMISHNNILHNSASIQKANELTQESVSVTWLPGFHDMGLIDGLIQPLYTGFLGVVMTPEAFVQKPLVWLKAITDYRGTHSGGPNMGYELCVQRITPEQQRDLDLTSWLSAYNGAEPIRRTTLERFADKFHSSGFRIERFYPCYGMAETTLIVTGGTIHDAPVFFNAQIDSLENRIAVEAESANESSRQIVGSGQAWLGTEVRIVEPETCTELADNQVGEVWVSGPSVALGYWNQPESTAKTFQAKSVDFGDKEFLRTGDLGFMRNGELFISGRIKDMIVVWGRNHFPHDIELTVQSCHPSLRLDCGAAVMVEVENQEKLVIIQEVDNSHLAKSDVDEIVSAIREAVVLSHDLQVHSILLIKSASIPRTSSGKIQRFACRQGYLKNNLAVLGEWRQTVV